MYAQHLTPPLIIEQVVASCLEDDWLMTTNRQGELTLRLEIRKKKATYAFNHAVDWIDGHVIGDHLYVACHVLSEKPSICFLKYHVENGKPLTETVTVVETVINGFSIISTSERLPPMMRNPPID